MTISRLALPRRTFLRCMGAVVGLPLLDAMIPAFASAATTKAGRTTLGINRRSERKRAGMRDSITLVDRQLPPAENHQRGNDCSGFVQAGDGGQVGPGLAPFGRKGQLYGSGSSPVSGVISALTTAGSV